MNWKLVAGLACGMALLLGACSGNNTTGTSSGTTPPTDENGNGGDGDAGTESTELRAAKTAFATAQTAVRAATEQAATAGRTNTEEDRAEARRLIGLARTALAEAGTAADAAVDAAGTDAANDAARGAAIEYRRDVVTPYRTAQSTVLDGLETPLLWFTRALVRQAIADPDFRVPRGTTTNDEGEIVSRATIVRTPRTKANAAGTAQIANTDPAPISSTTFKLVPYASGKKVFSRDAKHSGAETFKVDGYTDQLNTDDSITIVAGHTGLELTNSGLVIRYGGLHADWTDTRMKLSTAVDNAGADIGANGWDLTITFDDPQPRSAARGGVRSWQGNGDFYWKARVDAHSSQLTTGGDNYVAGLLTQPDGFKDLGTYEVWLSNHIGVNQGLEPVEGSGAVTCRDGSLSSANGNACPDDDVQRYLNYAAYGMFLYTADEDGLNFADINRPGGRVQSINFGYAAFENKANKRTTNIGEAITGKFNGRTIAVAYRGNARRIDNESPKLLSKLVRGDVELTVTIPKTTGTGNVFGHIDGFEEWDAANSRWKKNTGTAGGITLINSAPTRVKGTITRVDLYSGSVGTGADITANTGEFSGTAKVPTTGGTNIGDVLNDHQGTSPNNGGGVFRGNFYGPLATPNDLEVAGTWRLGVVAEGDEDKWSISGSFGAKRAPTPASSN